MHVNGTRSPSALHPLSTFVPGVLLALTPLFDIVRLITHNPAFARAAFYAALLGVLVVTLDVSREIVEVLTTDRHTRARKAGAAPLIVNLAALAPLWLGVFERIELAAAARAAASAALPSLTRLDAWPMALAIAGALAWLVGAWMEDERVEERVRYQPTGFPFKA